MFQRDPQPAPVNSQVRVRVSFNFLVQMWVAFANRNTAELCFWKWRSADSRMLCSVVELWPLFDMGKTLKYVQRKNIMV